MTRFLLMFMTLAAALTTGCTGSLGSDQGVAREYLTGSFGDVVVDGVPEIREYYVNRRGLFVDLRIQDWRGHWAMLGIEIPRETERLADGSRVTTFNVEEAEMIGCSGEVDDDWDFDCPPEEQEAAVLALTSEENGPLRLSFRGTFSATSCGDVPEVPGGGEGLPRFPSDPGGGEGTPRNPFDPDPEPGSNPNPRKPDQPFEGEVLLY